MNTYKKLLQTELDRAKKMRTIFSSDKHELLKDADTTVEYWDGMVQGLSFALLNLK